MAVQTSSTGGRVRGRTWADRLLGLAGAAMVLLAVGLLFWGGEGDAGAAPAVDAPEIELLQPRSGRLTDPRLTLIFRVDGDLRRMPGGWGVGERHLHLQMGGREIMPSTQDIERLPSGLYRWTLPRPPRGEHMVRLYWSGPDHRPITAGASRAIQLQLD